MNKYFDEDDIRIRLLKHISARSWTHTTQLNRRIAPNTD